MVRLSLLARLWLSLIALTIVAMPVNAEHLHLCFDGSEAPATVHAVEDGSDHHADEGVSAPHQDADVSLEGAALGKKYERAFDLSSLLVATVLIGRVPLAAPALVADPVVPVAVTTATVRSLPPRRGPPV